MADQAADPGAIALRQLVNNAVQQLGADSDRLGRALRTIPPDADHTPLEVFTALATARRHALASFAKILAVDTPDPLRGTVLTALSVLAAALGSHYRALRATTAVVRERENALATKRFAAAAAAFTTLDEALGKG